MGSGKGEDPEAETWSERAFAKIGQLPAYHPWKCLLGSVLATLIFAYGFTQLKSELRPDKQWVAQDSDAVKHSEYVSATWQSSVRYNIWQAKCKPKGCNIMDATYIQRLNQVHNEIMAIEIDGTQEKSKEDDYKDVSAADWKKYEGLWTFDGSAEGTRKKCVSQGPNCGASSVLEIFKSDTPIISALDDAAALAAINFWESQKRECPVSIVSTDLAQSPCLLDECQLQNTAGNQSACLNATAAYCDVVCADGAADADCNDNGCRRVWSALGTAEEGLLFNKFEPFSIASVASAGANGPVTDEATGEVESATVYFGFYMIAEEDTLINGREIDPIAERWEKEALCVLGLGQESGCTGDDLLEFTALFDVSFGEEFGAAIAGDIIKIAISYAVIAVYLTIMLSRRDSVHSMMGMAFVTVLVVGMSYACCMGLGGYISLISGLRNNNLTGNIPFLLLGLGVDDAFVLSAEFNRARKKNGKPTSIEERTIDAARHGGVSILITSLTDAAAFLIGSATKLPALSWFCIFAGLGVIFCFLFQLFVFLPALCINAKRADANKLDCLCCVTAASPHDFEEPQGCCGICSPCNPPDRLPTYLKAFGERIVSPVGKGITALVFLALLGFGIAGASLIYADFNLEWFIPEGSYLQTFFTWNDRYFESGTPLTVYTKDINYFEAQEKMTSIHTYLTDTKYVDQEVEIADWHHTFLEETNGGEQIAVEADYYTSLNSWLHFGGVRYSSEVQWTDELCSNATNWEGCDAADGIASAKIGATLALKHVNDGRQRYDTMVTLREEIQEIIEYSEGFPFNRDFVYWEEVGVVGKELVRNLAICAASVAVMIAIMIPHFRIAALVILSICLSVVEVLGFLHWWGVTISGVSSNYILISVGLVVDYSAHIAHAFVMSTGTSTERAVKALERMGPSVFNAIVSTMLAVIVLSTSETFIFQTFFRSLCLTVVLGGLHGLWLIPVLLSLMGGDKPATAAAAAVAAADVYPMKEVVYPIKEVV